MPYNDDPPAEPPSHRDLRLEEQEPWDSGVSPMEHQTLKMDRQIQAIHCRLLENATGGRLTWDGDTIIRNPHFDRQSLAPAATGRYAGPHAPITERGHASCSTPSAAAGNSPRSVTASSGISSS